MTSNKCTTTMSGVMLTLLLVAVPTLGRPSPYLDYAGHNSVVSQRGSPGHSVSGSYSWTSPEGTEFFVRYVADAFGYRVVESNALQRSAHGQLADGNQAYSSADVDSEEVVDIQRPQDLLREADASAEDYSQEDVSLEAQNEGFLVSSRGRTFDGRGLIPSETQAVNEQGLEAIETVAAVEAAPRSEVIAAETETIAPVPQEDEVSGMDDVVPTLMEMMKIDAQEISLQDQDASQTSPAEEKTETISEGGRPLEDTEEEAIVPAPEPEVDMTTSDRQMGEAALEEIIPAETEEMPTQTEEPVDGETSV